MTNQYFLIESQALLTHESNFYGISRSAGILKLSTNVGLGVKLRGKLENSIFGFQCTYEKQLLIIRAILYNDWSDQVFCLSNLRICLADTKQVTITVSSVRPILKKKIFFSILKNVQCSLTSQLNVSKFYSYI